MQTRNIPLLISTYFFAVVLAGTALGTRDLTYLPFAGLFGALFYIEDKGFSGVSAKLWKICCIPFSYWPAIIFAVHGIIAVYAGIMGTSFKSNIVPWPQGKVHSWMMLYFMLHPIFFAAAFTFSRLGRLSRVLLNQSIYAILLGNILFLVELTLFAFRPPEELNTLLVLALYAILDTLLFCWAMRLKKDARTAT